MNPPSTCCLPAVFLLLFGSSTGSFAQVPRSLATGLSPRTEALAEATVGIPGSSDAFSSNPAGLAARKFAWFAYSYREADPSYYSDGRFRVFEAGISTTFGTFCAAYRRYSEETSRRVQIPPYSAGAYDYTLGLGWAYRISSHVHLGLALKTIGEHVSYLTFEPVRSQPILFDLGLLLNTGVEGPVGGFRNNVSLGISLQNLGSPYRLSFTRPLSGDSPRDPVIPLPRMLHLGLSAQIALGGLEPGSVVPLRILLCAETMSAVNDGSFSSSIYASNGIGAELTVFEILSLRLGYRAEDQGLSIERAGGVGFRCGASLRIPLERFLLAPLDRVVLSAEYTAIPLRPRYSVVAQPSYDPFSALSSSYNPLDPQNRVQMFALTIAFEGRLLPL